MLALEYIYIYSLGELHRVSFTASESVHEAPLEPVIYEIAKFRFQH